MFVSFGTIYGTHEYLRNHFGIHEIGILAEIQSRTNNIVCQVVASIVEIVPELESYVIDSFSCQPYSDRLLVEMKIGKQITIAVSEAGICFKPSFSFIYNYHLEILSTYRNRCLGIASTLSHLHVGSFCSILRELAHLMVAWFVESDHCKRI